MIENINQNTRQTSRTLKIDGIAPTKALTTTYFSKIKINNSIDYFHTRIPSNLDSARNGRKARNVLMDLNAGISATPNKSRAFPRILTSTITKSNIFQPVVKYFFIPYANHLIINSIVNITVNILSNIAKTFENLGCCRVFTSSNALNTKQNFRIFSFYINLLKLYY
jgi:hypothetical protein